MELLSTIALDGAGAKAKKNSDKKKLKEAEGDPEKYNQIVENIEQRKKNRDKIVLYLCGIFLVYLILVRVDW
ncbi:MAG: hypothetical protein P8Q35_00425 [Candidatus Thalassarchaeaceae archaeon]|nr:hypothetical protein [Candidatus Thalassarchaeaceae archaeon]